MFKCLNLYFVLNRNIKIYKPNTTEPDYYMIIYGSVRFTRATSFLHYIVLQQFNLIRQDNKISYPT